MKMLEIGHIVSEPGVLGGEPHIAGHRIGVSDIAIWVNYHSMSPGEIASEFHLTLGEVHAALAYYYDHKEGIDRGIEEAERQAKEMAARYPKGYPLTARANSSGSSSQSIQPISSST